MRVYVFVFVVVVVLLLHFGIIVGLGLLAEFFFGCWHGLTLKYILIHYYVFKSNFRIMSLLRLELSRKFFFIVVKVINNIQIYEIFG